MSIKATLNILYNIFLYNYIEFKKSILNKIIDLFIWASLSIFVTGIVLPQMGLVSNFSNLQFGTILASVGIFEGYTEIFLLVSDIENKNTLQYELSYPISSKILFLTKNLINTLKFSVYTFIICILCKLVFWNFINFSKISLIRIMITVIISNFFYSNFILFISSFIKSVNEIGQVWSRFIFPLWFMGGFQFTWEALYKANRIIAYFDLLNPILYITKIFQIAFFEPNQSLYLYLYLLIIIILSICFFIIGFTKFKKRLDFI